MTIDRVYYVDTPEEFERVEQDPDTKVGDWIMYRHHPLQVALVDAPVGERRLPVTVDGAPVTTFTRTVWHDTERAFS
jgi:hypothetical protein